ncbi:MAG: hypothetical protein NTY15_05215 [Planctomycetota bacterium]|nr:hypothetical protein [Planctomycetota bacterium]
MPVHPSAQDVASVRALDIVNALDTALAMDNKPATETQSVVPVDNTTITQPSRSLASPQELDDRWSQAVDSKLNELMERSRTFERERVEIESLREHLKQAIETAESRIACSASDEGKSRLQELESQFIEAQRENTKISNLLLHARAEYQSLLTFIESEAIEARQSDASLTSIAQRVLEKTDARETELSLEVSQLHDQLLFLQCELADAKSAPKQDNAGDPDLRLQIEQLRSQLLEARHEAIELRMQSNDLGSRLAKCGPVPGQKSETLSWEQRKEALLQQLEAETHAETPCDPRKVLDIERIVEQTTFEIERRDQEIADLKTLIEQQSIAHDGMSIGVAAIAEMIESDALIISERLRLKELRDDWEQKQRIAEIEMSLERAKLARERLEIQEKIQRYEENNSSQTEDENQSGKIRTRGRWLARLGLRDE